MKCWLHVWYYEIKLRGFAMKIVYGAKDNWISDEWKLNVLDQNSDIYVKKIIANKYMNTELNSVEIETINRCNNDCSFCPVSVNNDIRSLKMMDEELYYKIIDDLSDMKYTGYISLFSNNEPLLDKRIVKFLKYAREKIPYAKHALCTNGLLITEEGYKELIELLDYLVIDNYNDDFEINESIKKIMNIEDTYSRCNVTLSLRKKNQVLLSRGGNSPNKKNQYLFKSACILPFFQMVIRPDGKVSRCCQDAYGEETLGDVSVNSIREVWNSENYNRLRKRMLNVGRTDIQSCSQCDLFGLNNYYDSDWIRDYTDVFIELVKKHIAEGKRIVIVGSNIESDEFIRLFMWNGEYIDSVIENIEQVEDDKFYIFIEYDWKQLLLFKNKNIGSDYVVFTKPLSFDYENKMKFQGNNIIKCIESIYENQTKENLVIFGTGSNAKKLINQLSLNPKFYVDNDLKKQDIKFNGKKVYGAESLYNKQYYIVVTPSDDESIIKQLLENGISKNNIVRGKNLIKYI